MKAKPKAMVSLMIKTRKTNKQTAKANPNNMAAIGARRVRDAKKGVEQRDSETKRQIESEREKEGRKGNAFVNALSHVRVWSSEEAPERNE